jgi:hypothetical protein
MKGVIQPDHIPVNKYQLIVVGIAVQLTPTEVSGIEDELNAVDLPDRTKATGGNRNPAEFTMMVPAHHTAEIAACEVWYKEGQEPVLPTYKKAGVILMRSISGNKIRARSLVGMWISKRTDPDLEMANDGEMAGIEYTVQVDDVLPG